ncbi:cobalt ECF transporter T component CbiQ [Haloarculaceae archaeon H-GB2-1]|nr:cobalt ECF transporter T component CbiQ [Haloarculaceae archaeon H-GB1-1]MEA5388840.1 cobalt ECF transporter T component CbiQ [Haloarculaceae archaeon H-GB11]MEA5406898.1 cobalt ECF transporter T component CbiQ [Haloarculaceae archaeon H-GB2-1]
MHHATLERTQQDATPRVDGHLNVYFALTALAVTVAAPARTTHLAAAAWFLALGYDAAGRQYLRFLKVPTYFLVPSLAVVLAFTAGDPIAALGPVTVTRTGVDRVVTTGLRSVASLSVLGYLVVTTPVPALFAALKRLRLPSFVVEFALLTYRGIQLLLAESERLHVAAAARLGFRNRRTTFRTTKLLSFSLFLKTLSRADAMEQSMRARGYDGKMPVPSVENRGHGYAVAALACLVLVGWLP